MTGLLREFVIITNRSLQGVIHSDSCREPSYAEGARPFFYLLPVLLIMFVSGCVQNVKKDEEAPKSGIYFVENRSVDRQARDDFNAAVALIAAQNYEEAINLLQKVVKSSQNNSAPYINLAIAYKRIGELEMAETQLEKALQINPDHPVANNEYALLCRESGRYELARSHYQRVVDKYPDYMPVRKNFGILCELYLNEPQCALDNYRAYLDKKPDDESVELWLTTLERTVGAE